jgi:cytochrome b subunit of formate dehydrogenase
VWSGAILLLLALAGAAAAQDTEECLYCHEEADITGERDGQEISVHVDPTLFSESVHGGFDCIDCHVDLADGDLHEEAEPVECGSCHDAEAEELASLRHGRLPVGSSIAPGCGDCHGSHEIAPLDEDPPECGSCHDQARLHARSLHGQAAARGDELAPGCSDCHDGHVILSARDPESPTSITNVPLLCGRCHREGSEISLTHEIHQDRILENYSMSIHGQGLFEQGLTVTAVCTSCHTAHDILPHTDPRSSIHRDNVGDTCEQCHGQIEAVHRQVIEGRLWHEDPDRIPVCVDCHSPHKIRRVLYPAGSANQDCLTCHANESLTMERDGETISLFVDEETFTGGAHGEKACAECHTDVNSRMERPCASIVRPVACGACHGEVVEEYDGGIHGRLVAEGDPDAPTCLTCHEHHTTLKKINPASPTFSRNVPYLCAGCHEEGRPAAVRGTAATDRVFASYIDSIHGKGLVDSGLLVTANCADCHTAHGELPASDEASSVHHENIAATCGSCHQGIEETFEKSVHWPGEGDEGHRHPSCASCHSSHTISRADRDDFRFVMMDQCGRCHEEESETFFDTFHGKSSHLGSAGAAKCYDCHGTHNILPTSDPQSTLGRDHVVATCGQCHAGSHRQFAGYLTHATHHDSDRYPMLFWSFRLMTILLVSTLTFALLHTLAWLVRLYLSRDEWKAHKELAKVDHKPLYRRFRRFARSLHLFMIISFFTLALTGLALKFSYTGLAQAFSNALGGSQSMAVLHRIGAVILFGVFFAHLWDVWSRKKRDGKTWWEVVTGPDSILFNLEDVKQFFQSIKWFLGIGPRPHYGRYTYWEKFDYFAVLWGIVIIGSTGLLLWFPEFFTRIIPGWSVNVATIVHSDEALLAIGFIFTIHFFNTHFRPDKFPMDPVIFTGRVTVDELKYDKPGEYERLVESGELEKHLVEPVAHQADRFVRFFGYTALFIGLTIIGLIVYSMLFAYR